ncbi:hypothetical protein F5148DRAFT_252114 [Russula earlei]|uniref:Uncharacterized protein n=1 Tax=Russula earlei TaxID=71964 RepID=A0ACC0U3Q5_9AGAM|nr:hypothetical protein F5148DRAFT_252114 [Russula earlei]
MRRLTLVHRSFHFAGFRTLSFLHRRLCDIHRLSSSYRPCSPRLVCSPSATPTSVSVPSASVPLASALVSPTVAVLLAPHATLTLASLMACASAQPAAIGPALSIVKPIICRPCRLRLYAFVPRVVASCFVLSLLLALSPPQCRSTNSRLSLASSPSPLARSRPCLLPALQVERVSSRSEDDNIGTASDWPTFLEITLRPTSVAYSRCPFPNTLISMARLTPSPPLLQQQQQHHQ